MKSGRISCLLFALAAISHPAAHAQFAVFDATNYANAVEEYQELEQLYTTATATRDEIVSAYNLAYQMSRMPQDLAARYKAEFAEWTHLTAPDLYGNTGAWTEALNLGGQTQAAAGYASAMTPLTPYPGASLAARDSDTQAILKTQYATSELDQSAVVNALATLGAIRSGAEAFAGKLAQLEADTFSIDPAQQTEMAVLGKLNTATVMQVHSQQDTNQILAALATEQIASGKQQIDAGNRALNQAIYFEQNFAPKMLSLTQGVSDTLRTMNLSIR